MTYYFYQNLKERKDVLRTSLGNWEFIYFRIFGNWNENCLLLIIQGLFLELQLALNTDKAYAAVFMMQKVIFSFIDL